MAKNSALSKLASIGKEKTTKAKPSRFELVLDETAQLNFHRWNSAKHVFDFVEARKDNMAEEMKEYCLQAMADEIIKQGAFPGNPQISIANSDGTPDESAIFQVQSRFVIKKGDDKPNEDTVIESLIDVGFGRSKAEELVANELDFTPSTYARPLNDLMEGHYEDRNFIEATEVEKSAGNKIAAFLLADPAGDAKMVIVEPLTAAEREVTIRTAPKIVVKKGFLERLTTYAKTAQEVLAIFKVITPVCFLSSPKFGISDSPTVKAVRLIKESAEILGVPEEVFNSNVNAAKIA